MIHVQPADASTPHPNPDAALLALAPTLIPLLEEEDREWAQVDVLYAPVARRAQEIEAEQGLDQTSALRIALQDADQYHAAYDACLPRQNRIEATVAPHMDVPAQTLEGLLLKQRIGRTLTHYGNDAARDLDALLTARAATLPFVAAAGLDPIFAAIERHRLTLEVFTEASNAADEVAVAQRGGDTSPGAMAVLDARRDEAAAADEQAWRDLFAGPPETAGGLAALLRYCALRYHAYHGMPDEPDVFAVLAAAARGLARQHHQHRAFVAAAGQMFGHEATIEIWARAAQQVPAAFADVEAA